jgi:hypothetical protein
VSRSPALSLGETAAVIKEKPALSLWERRDPPRRVGEDMLAAMNITAILKYHD